MDRVSMVWFPAG